MIACVIVIIFLIIADIAIFIPLIIVIRHFFVIRLETSFSLVLPLGSEACLSFAHLIELSVVVFTIVLEDLILLLLRVLVLQLLNDLLLLGPPLAVLQVVQVQLILQVVNVRVLLNISAIETL